MIREHVPTNSRDVEEFQLARQKSHDRRLIGRIQHRPARSTPPGRLVSQLQGGKSFVIRLFEVQRVQLLIQNGIIRRVLGSQRRMSPPLIIRILGAVPLFRRIPARLVGLGYRREHVRTKPA